MIVNRQIQPNQSIVVQNDCSNGDIVEICISLQNGVNFVDLDFFWVSARNLNDRSIPNEQRIDSTEMVHVVKEGIQHIFIKNKSNQICNLSIDIHVTSVPPLFYFPSTSATSGF